jgi:hypothetical protein
MDKAQTEEIQRRLDRERRAVRARIRAKAALPSGHIGRAGPDPEEYQKVSFIFSYDADDDHLFVRVGGPRFATTQEAGHGMYLRVDPDDYEIVGFEVLDYLRGEGEAKSLLDRIFPGLSAALEYRPEHVIETTAKKAKVKVNQLVPNNWPRNIPEGAPLH